MIKRSEKVKTKNKQQQRRLMSETALLYIVNGRDKTFIAVSVED